jgi:hypothetical protein
MKMLRFTAMRGNTGPVLATNPIAEKRRDSLGGVLAKTRTPQISRLVPCRALQSAKLAKGR